MRMRSYFTLGLLIIASAIGVKAQNPTSSTNPQNYSACINGFYGCNFATLSSTEQAAVADAARKRNYSDCLHGYFSCNPGQLAGSEQAVVADAARKRNYSDCLHGYFSCNPGQLSGTEQATVESLRQNGSAVGVVNSTEPSISVPVDAPCAENGSCYGDPNANGVPKTVHVDGYYRKDGTYVRGYYRSAPGTNPPRTRR